MKSNMHRRSGHVLIWALLAIIIVSIIVFAVWRKTPEGAEPPVEKAVAVRLLYIQPRQMPDIITVPGRIEGRIEATLAAEKPGRIDEITVEKGDLIQEGSMLLRIDDRIWKAALDQAEIELREATKDLERWEELQKAGAVSTKEYDSIQTRKEMAQVTRDQARVSLNQCYVISPIAGIVADRLVEVGEYANEGMPVLVVVDMDQVEIAIDVPEKDIFAVKAGEEIPFTVEAVGTDQFAGKVTFVSPLASRENNAFRTEITADNPDHLLKPGMIANVRLTRGTKDNAMVVPLAAVIPKKGEHVVFVAENDRAVRRTAKIDAIVGSEVILSSGVEPGEKVVIEGHRALADGMLLEIQGEQNGVME